MPEIQLSQGTIHYREQGSGPPVLLIHGVLVNGSVWEELIPPLARHHRCIAPDLPLGSHRTPMNAGADLSPPGLAALIAELIERLELTGVTLIGSDTGGALSQLVVAARPELVGRLVLVNCDAFEDFPPAAFRLLIKGLARTPGALAAVAAIGRVKPLRERSLSLTPLTVDPVPDRLLKAWIEPLQDARIRHDTRKVLAGIDPKHTLAATERLRAFERPVLIAWGTKDKFFPLSDAQRLAALFPDATLHQLPEARAFVQIDAPERLAELVTEFTGGASQTGAA